MVGATKGGTHLGVGGEGRGRKRWNDKRPAGSTHPWGISRYLPVFYLQPIIKLCLLLS